MSDEATVGDFLANLSGHGVYRASITDELVRFGFTYDPETDLLWYEGRSESLGAQYPAEIVKQMNADPKGGVLDESRISPGEKAVDALDLSVAIFKLLFPGQHPPSADYFGRGKGFTRNVEAISARTFEQFGNTHLH